jgi:hypothetical protein
MSMHDFFTSLPAFEMGWNFASCLLTVCTASGFLAFA